VAPSPASFRSRSAPPVRALWLALAGIVPAGAPLAAQANGDIEVVSLDFEGNEAFSSNELESVIRTRATGCASLLLQVLPICQLTDWGFAHHRQYLDTLDVAADELRLEFFYRDRGFFSAEVDDHVEISDRKARVRFSISEGSPTLIDSLSLSGVPPVLDSAAVAELIALQPGDRFDQFRLRVAEDSLVRALHERGFIQATVLEDLLRPPGGGARVHLDVSPGARFRVGRIEVEGAEDIGEGVVRDLLRIRSGEYLSQSRVEDGQRALFGVEAIRFASITTEVADDSIVDLRVQITPARTRAARGGFGWSTDQCVQTEATLTHRNLFGGAKQLRITARLDDIFAQQLGGRFPCSDVGTDSDFRTLNFLLRAELSIPVLFSGRNSFSASVFGERQSVPDVFIREGVGAQFGVTRQLKRGMTATLSWQPSYTGFDEESADIFFCVNFGFCTPEDIATVTRSQWLSPVTLHWVYNRTNDPLQPTNGHYLTAEIERAERFTGSDYRYLRVNVQAADFESLDEGLVVGARIRGGFVEPTSGPFSVSDPSREQEVIHPSKRFFAGGSQSVRGFGQNLLGPRVLVADQVEDCPDEFLEPCVQRLAAEDPGAFVQRPNGGNAAVEISLELRQRLSARWGLVLFVDGGNVFENLSSLEWPVWTPGAGIRLMTPVGPLRLDLGYNPTGPTPLPVVVSLENGSLVELRDQVVFDRFTYDQPSFLKEFWRRLQIHFSIGEAF